MAIYRCPNSSSKRLQTSKASISGDWCCTSVMPRYSWARSVSLAALCLGQSWSIAEGLCLGHEQSWDGWNMMAFRFNAPQIVQSS